MILFLKTSFIYNNNFERFGNQTVYLDIEQRTTELFFEEDLEVVPASQVTQQLKETEGPALDSHLSRDVNSGHSKSVSSYITPTFKHPNTTII